MGRVVRVLPDVSGLDKEFDYLVPPQWAAEVDVGSLVRVDLHGRRVAGWVVAVDVEPLAGVELREVTKISSLGPSAEVVGLAEWAAHRWQGRRAPILKTASPARMVAVLPQPLPAKAPVGPGDRIEELAVEAMTNPGVTVVRVPPSADLLPFFFAASACGDAVIVAPSVAEARYLGGRFRRAGGRVALANRDWALAATGGVVTGARSAIWATVPSLGAVVVLDEHDESLQEERNPTWHARDVAIERARRGDVPCVLVSPSPSVTALESADRLLTSGRADERVGWPVVRLIDRRQEDPGRPTLFSPTLVEALRAPGPVLCILNRKGRAQMLACGSCGELVRSDDGNELMAEVDGELVAPSGDRRPLVCANCGGTKLKRLRLGVNRAREELEALAGEPVAEITAETSPDEMRQCRIMVGTEALLHRVHEAAVVCFLDFDQELLASRYRAAEQAMGLLIRAARLVGAKGGTRGSGDNGRVLVQTRTPDHRVLDAAVRADPARFATAETEYRRALRFPPFGALAEVSGKGAAEMLEPLRGGSLQPLDTDPIDVLGPRPDGRFLVRASTPERLADILDALDRPKDRVRVAVDPPRV